MVVLEEREGEEVVVVVVIVVTDYREVQILLYCIILAISFHNCNSYCVKRLISQRADFSLFLPAVLSLWRPFSRL